MSIDMTIIIPHHHDENSLRDLLDSLNKQVTDFIFETVVVSNPPSRQADFFAKNNERCRNVNLAKIGVNSARNEGIRVSQGQLLFFLDSDCMLSDQLLLQKHYDFHKKDSEVACLGGVYEITHGARIDRAYNYLQKRWLFGGDAGGRQRYLLGGHFSCKKEVLVDDFFDENIIYGGSETELFFRLFQKGSLIILDENLKITHRTRLSINDFIKKLFRQGQGAGYFENKHGKQNEEVRTSYKAIQLYNQSYKGEMEVYLYLAKRFFDLGQESNGCSLSTASLRIFYFKFLLQFKIEKIKDYLRSISLIFK